MWRQSRDRLCEIGVGRQDFGVELADDQGIFYVDHIDIPDEDRTYIVAAVTVGFDANAIVGALEMNAFGADVMGSACDLAADGETVPVQESAIGDGNVAAGLVATGGVGRSRFDGDIVITNVGEDVVDANMGRSERIDGI